MSYFTVLVIDAACLIVERRTASEEAPPSPPSGPCRFFSWPSPHTACPRLGAACLVLDSCAPARGLCRSAPRPPGTPFQPSSLPENLWVCPAWEGACLLGHSWSLALRPLAGHGPRAGWARCHLVLTYSSPQPMLSKQRLATSQMRSQGSGGGRARQGTEAGEWSRRSPGFQ